MVAELEDLRGVDDAGAAHPQHEPSATRPLIIWLGLMGTRWAETVGLERHKIRDGAVRIDSSLSEVNGCFYRVPTKTYVARTLPLPVTVQEQLDSLGQELLFTTRYGNPIRSAAFRSRVFLPAIERAGVRPLHIHGLRHTCASLLASQGAPPKVIQAWLGHQDLRTTMTIFTHAFSADVIEAARRFDRLLADTPTPASTRKVLTGVTRSHQTFIILTRASQRQESDDE